MATDAECEALNHDAVELLPRTAMPDLKQNSLVKSERGRLLDRDDIRLATYGGSDFIQWYGRCSDGRNRPIGRIMRIVSVSTAMKVAS